MSGPAAKPHHPLPGDKRARRDRIPEGIVESRDLGDDDPGADGASRALRPDATYRDPDGKPYPA